MADEDEQLGDYLDNMIRDVYVTVKFSGYIIRSPSESDIIKYIEDVDTGRPVPIDDSADHFLLRQFDVTRRDLLNRLPIGVNRGCMRRLDGTYQILAHQQPHEVIIGEIPWRTLHTEE